MLEVIALVVLVVVAVTLPSRSLLSVLTHPVWMDHAVAKPLPAATLGLAIVSAIFTCSGAHWALYFGEELKDAPRRIGSLLARLCLSRLLRQTCNSPWTRRVDRGRGGIGTLDHSTRNRWLTVNHLITEREHDETFATS